ncbi:hypothetical protein [Actinoplanes aureus]|uniref:Uncharacterized protein n=1 Tax=Actinoplanes aureus TaxID=2792083 RepID=A0A931FZ46_9ACTN|nr:hypothetical protein [Actinoplanes aureus]MBG0565288.1 hypothetical protein [Actinoplanes aureus]
MRLRALLRRLVLPAVAGSLALTGLAMPARAAETPEPDMPMLGILSPETVTVINGQSKTVKIDVWNVGNAVKDVVLDFGTAGKPVAADLGFTPPAGCTGSVCALGDFKTGEKRTVKFTLKPSAPAGASPAKVLGLATSVGGVKSFETSITVVRTAKGGADLEIGDIKDLKLGRGQSADVPFTVANTGNQEVKAFGLLVLPVFGGVEAVLNYRNCLTDEEMGGGLICVFNEPLAAGGAFALPESTPLRVKAASDAAGPYDYPVYVAAVGLTDTFVLDFAAKTAGAKGAELKLAKLATVSAEPKEVEDLNPEDNITDFSVSVPKSSSDSAAVGGAFTGAVGDSSTVKVGVRNLGPTGMIPASLTWFPYVHVRLPSGIDLTEVDNRCLPGTNPDNADYMDFRNLAERDFVCLVFEDLRKGDQDLFRFTADILEGEHKAGSVTVDGGVQDSKSGNDKAAVTVELTAGGSGGGLPITGAPAGLVAGAGAVLLVAGFFAYRMARRRRIVTVVD